jgi:hypothetical protein
MAVDGVARTSMELFTTGMPFNALNFKLCTDFEGLTPMRVSVLSALRPSVTAVSRDRMRTRVMTGNGGCIGGMGTDSDSILSF